MLLDLSNDHSVTVETIIVATIEEHQACVDPQVPMNQHRIFGSTGVATNQA